MYRTAHVSSNHMLALTEYVSLALAAQVALHAIVARDKSKGVLRSLKGLSERLLSPTHLVSALRLQMLLPAALSSAVGKSLGYFSPQNPLPSLLEMGLCAVAGTKLLPGLNSITT